MVKIFISYRRADSNDESRQIYEALVKRFGEKNIFRDKDRIPKGVDFRKTIEQYVFDSDEMLVIIGKKWLDIRETGDTSKRRLDNPDDFVRIEIDMGLRHIAQVTPVVIHNATMPNEEELPRRIVQLGFQNAYFLSPENFENDLQILVDDIAQRHKHVKQGFPSHWIAYFALFIISLFGIILVDSLFLNKRNTNETEHIALAGVTSNAEWELVAGEQGYVHEFDNLLMVLTPAGCFTIGSEGGSIDEINGNEVCLQPFWIDKYEVTNEQYEQCILSNECSEILNSEFTSTPNQPVNSTTWFQAQTYCAWRNGRLPSEAEWEFAARGPDELIYPWGNDWNPLNVNWAGTTPNDILSVGSFENGASWVGALDMSGNVWEWTNSLYQPYPYDTSDGREEDTGGHSDVQRVLRGGSLVYSENFLRASNRQRYTPDDTTPLNIGIRCVRSYNE